MPAKAKASKTSAAQEKPKAKAVTKGKMTTENAGVAMPSAKDLEKLKQQDEGFVEASQNALAFLESRRQAVYTISRHYHLDVEELAQEGYEVLLTCLRDFSPVYQKKSGDIVSVKFTTFFGNRMENRAMEMRNRDPEYQARQAYTEKLSETERTRFKADPPLLVQHLDQESAMQEMLAGEASQAQDDLQDDLAMRIARDSFFDNKLAELVAREKDEKKQAALLHVKVGGIYNFQEIAYHFGVTDSRASQVMNELMDAFYVQRMIDGNLESVVYDFQKLKFNGKRVVRLIKEAMQHTGAARSQLILDSFKADYPEVSKLRTVPERKEEKSTAHLAPKTSPMGGMKPPAYEKIFTAEEEKEVPLVGVEIRALKDIKPATLEFRSPTSIAEEAHLFEQLDLDATHHPILIAEDGTVIDGMRRLEAAKRQGKQEYLCIVRAFSSIEEKKRWRVMVNARLRKPSKYEVYFMIGALSDIGLSQQRIAEAIGSSRTNVLVYAKVRDKATPKLRALFEDQLIQITNASTCTDFDAQVQDELSDFIRRFGVSWSKGAKFNELYKAAANNKIAQFAQKAKPDPSVAHKSAQQVQPVDVAATAHLPGNTQKVLGAYEKRLKAYEQMLRDNEVWSAQRESVINAQNDRIEEFEEEIERLKRELEASELLKFGNQESIEQELKNLKSYYLVTERIAGAFQALTQAARQVRRIPMRRSQYLELSDLFDKLESSVNQLRLELLNHDQAKVQREDREKKQLSSA